jgi:hypothetical protein
MQNTNVSGGWPNWAAVCHLLFARPDFGAGVGVRAEIGIKKCIKSNSGSEVV